MRPTTKEVLENIQDHIKNTLDFTTWQPKDRTPEDTISLIEIKGSLTRALNKVEKRLNDK